MSSDAKYYLGAAAEELEKARGLDGTDPNDYAGHREALTEDRDLQWHRVMTLATMANAAALVELVEHDLHPEG